MIFEYECEIIVMLCKWTENNRIKCNNYIDINNLNINFSVKNIEIKKENELFSFKKLTILNKKTNVERQIYHINYLDWVDHGVPKVEKCIDTFMEIFYYIKTNKYHSPFVVHCSAGVGRTGTFISLYLLYEFINLKIRDSEMIQFNIFNLVRQLKEMRIKLVENDEQYFFIYQFIKYLLENYEKYFQNLK